MPSGSVLVSEVVPDDQLMANVEQLSKELGSRNAVTLESAKIAAYMMKDMDFLTALKTDDLVSHRMRYYTNPLNDVEGYLHSQKGGGTTGVREAGGSEEVISFKGSRFKSSRSFGSEPNTLIGSLSAAFWRSFYVFTYTVM